MIWSTSWLTPRLSSWLESRRRRARFREAVREYAYACAEEEFERAGYVGISGGDSWAYETCPRSWIASTMTFGPFAEFSFPGDRRGTEDCFARRLRDGMRDARCRLD